MIKIFCLILLTVQVSTLSSQVSTTEFDVKNWVAPYSLPTNSGWDVERFMIPISFAPGITYHGIEDIRFAPGWGKVSTTDYWSYAFLWFLNESPDFNSKRIKKNLQLYYTGLIGSNIEKRKIPANKLFQTKASIKKMKTEKGDLKTFSGSIYMLDYMEQKPITLNCKVHVKSCSGLPNMFIFYEISPQPWSGEIWKSLDKLWQDFDCSNKEKK
ncbi:MAG: hypothetical protein ABI761_09950 [Saprospiraceae bacterium]